MTIGEFLRDTTRQFEAAHIPTPRLDAQAIVAHVLSRDRSWLLAHGDELLDAAVHKQLRTMATQRLARQPLAYLTGCKEFYGRQFAVTPDVLIPRPETEQIIEELARLQPRPGDELLDIGTGSGAIAVTAALEWPGLIVTATDTSSAALAIARKNATSHDAHVRFSMSDLLERTPQKPCRFIVANLPYVDPTWDRSPETDAEPALALFAHDNGLALIKKLLAQTPFYLSPGGYLLLEADPRQFKAIKKAAAEHLVCVAARGFAITFQKNV
jgi:release factor glutamine methyltransferase